MNRDEFLEAEKYSGRKTWKVRLSEGAIGETAILSRSRSFIRELLTRAGEGESGIERTHETSTAWHGAAMKRGRGSIEDPRR